MGKWLRYLEHRYLSRLFKIFNTRAPIGVDLDSTLHNPKTGKPFLGAEVFLFWLKYNGWHITIYTSRPKIMYFFTKRWLRKHNLFYNRLVCGKLPFIAYVGDEAIYATGRNWEEVKNAVCRRKNRFQVNYNKWRKENDKTRNV